ncbi:MAG: hypothetical protein KGZ80_04525 [Methylomonas sp.]|nr:hypothetical protein [Methylomonas sp.]
MQTENIENSYLHQACQSLLAGDQKSALEYARKAFPSLYDDHETFCLTTLELLDLAKDHHLDVSLSINGVFQADLYLGATSSLGFHALRRTDGRTHKVLPVDFLRFYPNSLGKVWRVDRKTPAKSLHRALCNIRQSIIKRMISLSYFSPLVYFN